MCRRRTTKSHLLRAIGRGLEDGVCRLLPGGKLEQAVTTIVDKGEQKSVIEPYWIKSFA